jgi:hypothetical protein
MGGAFHCLFHRSNSLAMRDAMTRGLDLNNPMNLMENSINWKFQIKPTRDPQGRLAQFRSMEDGLHAGVTNLLNQQLLHGLNTWRSIITKFAPPLENDTEAYIADLCAATGCSPDDEIDLRNPQLLATASIRIIIHEQGTNPCAPEQIAETVSSVLSKHQQTTH